MLSAVRETVGVDEELRPRNPRISGPRLVRETAPVYGEARDGEARDGKARDGNCLLYTSDAADEVVPV